MNVGATSKRIAAALVMAGWLAGSAAAQDPKTEVLNTGQALFDAMARRDTAAIRTLMHPAASLVAAVVVDGKPEPRVSTLSQFVEQIATIPSLPIERMWNAQVQVSGPIATIWTQYDFHRGREFSHCGIDSFQLIKTPTGWQVLSLIYTIVRDRCPKHPAGPPR